ncbi:MAG TPA: hypothetical protein VF384_19215 [Planctomycetota bacterium]
MNCNTCRYELSQCLDGRLPSGRRTIVMGHVANCAVCSAFWTELQAAQNLTMRLAAPRVSEGFRERLWERIAAGEGTPEAVFHERVPLLTKFRYALTGAAAAAVVLLAVTWTRGDREAPQNREPSSNGVVAKADLHGTPEPQRGAIPTSDVGMQVDQSPMMSSARPLTGELVALEAARQLEQRHATANLGIRRLKQNGFGQNTADRDMAVAQVLEDADAFCGFGGLLLDLREHDRLFFSDSEIEAELRVAVKLVRKSQQGVRNLETVRSLVEPALQSGRLASVSRTIMLPLSDPRDELDMLMRLAAMRHDVFPMLFITFGNIDEATREFDLPGNFFTMKDPCGQFLVAPRSEVEAGDGRLRIFRAHVNGTQGMTYEVQIRSGGPR